jgi:hypothetical protein
MNEKLLTIIGSAGMMSLIFWIFNKYFPANKSKYQSLKSLRELRQEFWIFDFLILFLFFVLTPIFVYLTYQLFGVISDLRFSKFVNDGFLFLPDQMMWLIPAIFSGLGLAGFVFIVIQKPLLKEKYYDYTAYYNMKYGFDADKASKFLIKFLLVLVTCFFILAINNYAHFGNEKIQISNFFQLSEYEYEYDDIVEIKSIEKLYAPNGNVVSDNHFVIDFTNKNKWSSRHGGNSNHVRDEELINHILNKTGYELTYLEFDQQ